VNFRAALKEILPPVALRMVGQTTRKGIRFEGRFRTWRDAQAASSGYQDKEIVRRVYEAECKVRSGEAADERDSVLFDSVQFSLPIMAALARIASRRSGQLQVLDLGGALGGLYRQYLAFGLPARVIWNVVEQPDFVKFGRSFETTALRFHASIEEVLANGVPDLVLLSSVMQYIENPFETLRKITASGIPHIVIDRTPCFDQDQDLLTVQRVPPEIYEASYPCWIFSRTGLLRALQPRYRLVAAFSDPAGPLQGPGLKFDLGGFMFDLEN